MIVLPRTTTLQPSPWLNGNNLPSASGYRSGSVPASNQPLPAFFNHPWMRKFGAMEHQQLETRLMWLTPTLVPFLHLTVDNKDEKWGLFARDEMALLVGAGIFLGTNLLTHKLFAHLGWFKGSLIEKDKGNFFAYAVGHTAALLHGGFTAMWFGKWADAMFVHPVNPAMPVGQRVQNSLLRTPPAQWLRNMGVQLPVPPKTDAQDPAYPLPTPMVANNSTNQEQQPPASVADDVKTATGAVIAKQRSGQALPNPAEFTSFSKKWMKNLQSDFGETPWAIAQKLSGCFIAVPIIPLLRWHQYVTPEQHLDKQEAERKRLELASRDATALLGGNVLYLGIWVTALSVLEHHYPQMDKNYRQNIATVLGDFAKTVNAGIFAVVFSKWLTARKKRKQLQKALAHQPKTPPPPAEALHRVKPTEAVHSFKKPLHA
ncbi:MAG: hypothetical protein NTW61_00120 [Candidatus Melainabacteria bacterium]|nr:hypothetical protein [Candidatus Melainabacteria bacterium]